MFRREAKAVVEEKQTSDTIVGAGTKFEGTLAVEGSLLFEGRLEGSLIVSGPLRVGKNAYIHAEVRAHEARIAGHIKGNVRTRESVELLAGSKLEGDVYARAFRIEDGAIFQGNCFMGDTWSGRE
ncbi:MAG: polymer-forming cytoskeletal protein [Candidatus Eisenbacteria bacterium]|nr:polymer-forming cytoskeletal protein [Candidatus Eisenbacteria bacterium]